MGYRLMLSFKTNEKWLYDEVMRHSGKGNWIKDILEEHIKKNSSQGPQEPLKLIMEDDFSILGDFK